MIFRGECMINYYVALQTRAQAFLLERRLKDADIKCELAFMPREIMRDLCNMGVKLDESEYQKAIKIVRRAGISGCNIYKEIVYPNFSKYFKENI